MPHKSLEIDMIAGSALRDVQGEMLSVEGADISELEAGRGRVNDNHGSGFFNCIGSVTYAKKIFKSSDCDDERQQYYWDKVKSPFIYMKGKLFDNDDHPNAKAAAAIIRNIHRSDCPLKVKASVEGGVVARGINDPSLLARTKIHSVALTFTPANTSTLVEPLNLDKTAVDWTTDLNIIQSVVHLAKTDVPSFRAITRDASASTIVEKLNKARDMAQQLGFKTTIPEVSKQSLIESALTSKLSSNINKINELSKALTAGYGGGSSPSSKTGGDVLQAESLDTGVRGFKYITCHQCGQEQPHLKYQVKCNKCNKAFSLASLYKVMIEK